MNRYENELSQIQEDQTKVLKESLFAAIQSSQFDNVKSLLSQLHELLKESATAFKKIMLECRQLIEKIDSSELAYDFLDHASEYITVDFFTMSIRLWPNASYYHLLKTLPITEDELIDIIDSGYMRYGWEKGQTYETRLSERDPVENEEFLWKRIRSAAEVRKSSRLVSQGVRTDASFFSSDVIPSEMAVKISSSSGDPNYHVQKNNSGMVEVDVKSVDKIVDQYFDEQKRLSI